MKEKLLYYRDLVVALTVKELKVRYKNNFLGYIWSVANPLALAGVFYLAFKIVLRIQMENYTLFLISALFPWQWFSNSVTVSSVSFISNASLIKKLKFPRSIVPMALVLQDMLHFLFAIPVIVFFLLIYKKPVSLSWLYGIPILLVIQFMMTYGVTLMVSSVNLFFRDVERLTGIFIVLLFYCTPIIYPASMIPEQYKLLLSLNPMSPLMISWRDLLLTGELRADYVFLSLLYSVISLAIGYYIYRKLSWRFAEVL